MATLSSKLKMAETYSTSSTLDISDLGHVTSATDCTEGGRIPDISTGLSMTDTNTTALSSTPVMFEQNQAITNGGNHPPVLLHIRNDEDKSANASGRATHDLSHDFPGVNKVLHEMATVLKTDKDHHFHELKLITPPIATPPNVPSLPLDIKFHNPIINNTKPRPPLLKPIQHHQAPPPLITFVNSQPPSDPMADPVSLPPILPVKQFIPWLVHPNQLTTPTQPLPSCGKPPLLLESNDPLTRMKKQGPKLLTLPQQQTEPDHLITMETITSVGACPLITPPIMRKTVQNNTARQQKTTPTITPHSIQAPPISLQSLTSNTSDTLPGSERVNNFVNSINQCNNQHSVTPILSTSPTATPSLRHSATPSPHHSATPSPPHAITPAPSPPPSATSTLVNSPDKDISCLSNITHTTPIATPPITTHQSVAVQVTPVTDIGIQVGSETESTVTIAEEIPLETPHPTLENINPDSNDSSSNVNDDQTPHKEAGDEEFRLGSGDLLYTRKIHKTSVPSSDPVWALSDPGQASTDPVQPSLDPAIDECKSDSSSIASDDGDDGDDPMKRFKRLEKQLMAIEDRASLMNEDLVHSRKVLHTIERMSISDSITCPSTTPTADGYVPTISTTQQQIQQAEEDVMVDRTSLLIKPIVTGSYNQELLSTAAGTSAWESAVERIDQFPSSSNEESGTGQGSNVGEKKEKGIRQWMEKKRRERTAEYKKDREKRILKERVPYTPRKQMVNCSDRSSTETEAKGNQRLSQHNKRLSEAKSLLSDILTTATPSPRKGVALLSSTLPNSTAASSRVTSGHVTPRVTSLNDVRGSKTRNDGRSNKRKLSSVDGLSEAEQLKLTEIFRKSEEDNRVDRDGVSSAESSIDWSQVDQLLLSA